MKTIEVPVTFTGTVTVEVPEDSNLSTEILADIARIKTLARIMAVVDSEEAMGTDCEVMALEELENQNPQFSDAAIYDAWEKVTLGEVGGDWESV